MSSGTIHSAISFLVDRKGRKTHAVLPIDEYGQLLEDLEDLAVVASRRDEGYISLDELKKRLYGNAKVPD